MARPAGSCFGIGPRFRAIALNCVWLPIRYTRRSHFRFASSKAGIRYAIAEALGHPVWEDSGDARMDDGVQIEPDRDLAEQPAPDFEVDQRVSW